MLKLSQKEMQEFYDSGKEMIWNYKTLYQICYSQAQQCYYMIKVLVRAVPVTMRGRFHAMTVEEARRF